MRISDWSSDVCSSDLIGDAVDADVDHGRARLDPFALHHLRPAHGGDDDVGAMHDRGNVPRAAVRDGDRAIFRQQQLRRSEEHTSELQSLMRISYAVFCLKKKKNPTSITTT